MDTIILAAGQGTRLRPLTKDRPKGLLHVAGEPMIHHLLQNLSSLGVKEATLVVGHGQNHLRSFLGDGLRYRMSLSYVAQATQLGAGHALEQAAGQVKESLSLVLPADAWNSKSLLKKLLAAKEPTIAWSQELRSKRHGVPDLHQGRARDLHFDRKEGDVAALGAYVLPRRVVDALPNHGHRLGSTIGADMRENGAWAAIEATGQEHVDVIDVEGLLEVHSRLMPAIEATNQGAIEDGVQMHGSVHIGEGTVIRAGSVIHGPVHIGAHCTVGPLAFIGPGTSLRNHVAVGPFVSLRACAIGSNVTLMDHVRVRNAFIDLGVQAGAGVSIGGDAATSIGADTILEDQATVRSGGRIGHDARIAAGRAVKQVPDAGVAV